MKHHYRRDTCRLCDGHDIELVVELTPMPIGDSYVDVKCKNEVQEIYPLGIFWCRSCGQVQINDVIDPEVLYSDFLYETSISLGLVEHFQRFAKDTIVRLNFPKDSLVIDIGSNDGTFLRAFQNEGMRVLGIEPAYKIAKKATESGIETQNTLFSIEQARELKEKRGCAIMVSANNTFANIDNLDEFAKGISELLAPEGVFIFETGYLLDLIQGSIIDNVYHEHLSYFRVKPLANFFQRHGLELIEIEHVVTKGGSLRGTVQLANGPRVVSPSVNKYINLETSLGFERISTFKAFVSRIDTVKRELIMLLRDLQDQGKTIAGYGASVGVTTLLYHFDVGEILNFLLDDNPVKHNLLSPGYHLPVLPSEAIYDHYPDYVLVLAWRYLEPIMKKHQKYLEQGGHFIVPLPAVEII